MSQVQTTFGAIKTTGESAAPKFNWPLTSKQRWVKIDNEHADGIEGNTNRGVPFAADCPIMGNGADDRLSPEEMALKIGVEPAVLELCKSYGHPYYRETGKEMACPVCDSEKLHKAQGEVSVLTEQLRLTTEQLADAQEKVGALSMQLKNAPPPKEEKEPEPDPEQSDDPADKAVADKKKSEKEPVTASA